MSTHATHHQTPITPSDDEVLVRVDGVGKKFCRSLKKSLWYGVCDIGAELNPFRRRGELRTLGRSEKEISKKCLGETKVPDSVGRRHQYLGLIGHNGALPALLAVAG